MLRFAIVLVLLIWAFHLHSINCDDNEAERTGHVQVIDGATISIRSRPTLERGSKHPSFAASYTLGVTTLAPDIVLVFYPRYCSYRLFDPDHLYPYGLDDSPNTAY